MRCEPKDLAVIVRTGPMTKEFLGRVVRVLSAGPENAVAGVVYATWYYEPRMKGKHGELEFVEDACLRPIRDPGDGAKDETLDWLPVPERESELTEELIHAFEREFLLQYIQRMERT